MEQTIPTITFSRNLVHQQHHLKEAVSLATEEIHDMFIVAKHNKILPCHRSLLALFSPLTAHILSEVPCCIAPTLFLTDYHDVNIRTLLHLIRSGETVVSQNINADIKVVKEIAQLLEISLADIAIGPYLDNPLSGTFQIKQETNNCVVKTEIKKEVEELKEAQELEKCDELDECDYVEEDETVNNFSCGIFKMEEAGTVHSKVSFGIETNKDMVELEANVVTTDETVGLLRKEVSEKTGGIVTTVQEQETNDQDMIIDLETNVATTEKTDSISQKLSQNPGVIVTTVQETSDQDMIIDLETNIATTEKTAVAHKSVSYHSREGTFISPTQHSKINDLHVDEIDTCIKTDSKENSEHKRMPVKIKIKKGAACRSFNSERDTPTEKDEFRGSFDAEVATMISNIDMTGSIFENHEGGHFSYQENGVTELTAGASKYENRLKENLQIHSREKRHFCLYCPKMFKKVSYLKAHTFIHTGDQPFKCEFCSKKYTKSGNLVIHTRIHTGEKPYKCGVCPNTFKCYTELKMHTMSHTGEEPFKCGVCPKQYKLAKNLKEHTRTHTGEKPFKCIGCNKRFAYSSSFRKHKRICSVKL